MEIRKLNILICLLIFTIIVQVSAVKKSYIVYLGSHRHGSDHATVQDFEHATNSHYNLLGSYVGSELKAREAIIYSYTKSINGFAATLEEEDAKQIARHPDVISVIPNKLYKLHTTRSWSFLGIDDSTPYRRGSNPARTKDGKDVIIGTLDSGVWPESKSFSDVGMGPIPFKWRGHCENNTRDGVPCNNKLIGARYFNKGILEAMPYLNLVNSARDMDGHGSHTLSTAAGKSVPGASSFGYANGTARGGAPGAHVAVYKVCWGEAGCSYADVLAGFDAAIDDNVDIISVSLGDGPAYEGGTNFLRSTITLGAFHAAAKGIAVVCSAGNDGPYSETVGNISPWVFTVGASTLDRDFPSYVKLGNQKLIKGASQETKSLPENQLYPLIFGSDAPAPPLVNTTRSQYCNTSSLDPEKVKGKIVVCILRRDMPRVVPGITVRDAGGAGMVLVGIYDWGSVVFADPHVLPATMITFDDAVQVISYMNSTKNPMGTIVPARTRIGVEAPAMAYFSSRGPCYPIRGLLKPDVTAPGVDILAAYTESKSPSDFDGDTRRSPFYLLSGTSMACPHVSGVVGRLKSAHPDWSFSAIKSAIMTTATTIDNMNNPMKDSDGADATPFAYGNGHIRPTDAADPGLVYDNTIEDYLYFLCTLGYKANFLSSFTNKPFACPSTPMKIEDLNYPSISVGALNRTIVLARRLKNVGPPGTYKVHVEAPNRVHIAVQPAVLTFSDVGEEKAFNVAIMSLIKRENEKGYKFGKLVWSDGNHQVRSTIVINVVA